MLVGDIMRGDVKTAEAGDTFADVAKQMRANGISSSGGRRPARRTSTSPALRAEFQRAPKSLRLAP